MKHFLVLISSTGKQTIFTEQGLQVAKRDKQLAEDIEVIGECDNQGNLTQDYSKGNFLNEAGKTKTTTS